METSYSEVCILSNESEEEKYKYNDEVCDSNKLVY